AWHRFRPKDQEVTYVASHHLSFAAVRDGNLAPFLRHYLNSAPVRAYTMAHATGKSQIEVNKWSILRIPVPTRLEFTSVLALISEVEHEIQTRTAKLKTLQTIIDEELLNSKIRSAVYAKPAEEHF